MDIIMPVRSDEPLRKVTLNLYEADCVWFEREYGHGWTERIRQHIHSEVMKREHPIHEAAFTSRRRTLGDLAE